MIFIQCVCVVVVGAAGKAGTDPAEGDGPVKDSGKYSVLRFAVTPQSAAFSETSRVQSISHRYRASLKLINKGPVH